VLGSYGGRGTPELKPTTGPVGKQLESTRAAPPPNLIKQLTLEGLTPRGMTVASHQDGGREYDIRVTPHGSYCALCVIRAMLVQSRPQRLTMATRPDLAEQLTQAIDNAQIGLRYVSRHDLATGRLVARVGYLRWRHPRYGEIHPQELVRLAETTG